MGFIFLEDKKQLKITFTSELKEVICLKDYHIFLYFRSGQYQIWDLIKNNLVISKSLPNDICQFAILSDYALVYLRRSGVLKVHDIFKNTEYEYFSAEIPTSSGLSYNTFGVDYEVYSQNIIAQSVLYAQQQDAMIYFVERINVTTLKIKHVVSIFNPSTSTQAIHSVIQDHHNPLQFTYLFNSAKFALWDQFFLDPSNIQSLKKKGVEHSFFYLGEFIENKLSISKFEILNTPNLENSLNSVVVGIGETNVPNRIIVLENTNIVPILKVLSLEKQLILKQISFEVDPRGYCISEMYCVAQTPPSQNYLLSFLEMDDTDTHLNIYKFRKNFKDVLNSKVIKKPQNWMHYVDRNEGKYCLGIEKKYVPESNLFKDMPLNVIFYRGVRSKMVSLHLLLKLSVYHIYIIKDVLSFIPE